MHHPSAKLQTAGLQALDANPPIDETAPSVDDVKEAVAKLRSERQLGVCKISAELLKVRYETMIHKLHGIFTAI